MNRIKPLAHIQAAAPYVPGGKLPGAIGPVAMLASNENPFGCSPMVDEAIRAASQLLHVYPDPDYGELRAAIGAAKGIRDISRIVTAAGSDEIIHLLTQCYAGPGDEVLFTEHAFSMYRVSACAHGALPVTAAESGLTASPEAILDMVTERTRLLFLANPNNPTGTMLTADQLRALQDALPPHVLFVIDGAYSEYVGPDYEAELRDLVDRRDNTVMIRTFSKIYGLASLRLGWGYMPEAIASVFQRIRGPFNVNGLAVAAGIAAVQDDGFVANSRVHNSIWREHLRDALNGMGLPTPRSEANFIISDLGSPDRAAEANRFLKDNGILVRSVAGYGLPERLRISVGSESDNRRLLEAVREFVEAR